MKEETEKYLLVNTGQVKKYGLPAAMVYACLTGLRGRFKRAEFHLSSEDMQEYTGLTTHQIRSAKEKLKLNKQIDYGQKYVYGYTVYEVPKQTLNGKVLKVRVELVKKHGPVTAALFSYLQDMDAFFRSEHGEPEFWLYPDKVQVSTGLSKRQIRSAKEDLRSQGLLEFDYDQRSRKVGFFLPTTVTQNPKGSDVEHDPSCPICLTKSKLLKSTTKDITGQLVNSLPQTSLKTTLKTSGEEKITEEITEKIMGVCLEDFADLFIDDLSADVIEVNFKEKTVSVKKQGELIPVGSGLHLEEDECISPSKVATGCTESKGSPYKSKSTAEKVLADFATSGVDDAEEKTLDEIVAQFKSEPVNATRLDRYWKCVMFQVYGIPQAKTALKKDLGMLRKFASLVGYSEVYDILLVILQNWQAFAKQCEENGAYSPPKRPHVGFLLQFANAALEFHGKHEPDLTKGNKPFSAFTMLT